MGKDIQVLIKPLQELKNSFVQLSLLHLDVLLLWLAEMSKNFNMKEKTTH